MAPSILIADDDRDVCEIVVEEFERLGHRHVHTATSVSSALAVIRQVPIDLAIIDVNFTPDGKEGLPLISRIHQESPETFIVVLSVVDNPGDIVEAIRRGAEDYITKDAAHVDLSTQLDAAIRQCVGRIERQHLREVEKRLSVRKNTLLVGESENLRQIRAAVHRAHANRLSRFVVVGASGTGKGALADYIIALDPAHREAGTIRTLTFNCGATTPELARSELFGIAANSGLPNVPANGKPGAFALARGGYLVVDDFQDLPETLYPAFLQVLERSEVKPLGGAASERVAFRLIVTTQRPLDDFPTQLRRRLEMDAETFVLLPLHKRPEDILPLAQHYLHKLYVDRRLIRPLQLSAAVERALLIQNYVANVGDLHHLLFRLALAEPGETISQATYERITASPEVALDAQASEFRDTLRASIQRALDDHAGDVKRAAEALGLDPQALRREAAKHHIEVGRRWRPQTASSRA
jgi:DNA-binding NtrC family response regulator